MDRILKLLIVVIVLFFAWKYLSPKLLKKDTTTTTTEGSPAGTFVNSSCIAAADKASSAWGSGIGRFVNPPYDMDAWSVFRSDIDSKIANAQGQCACVAESCHKIQSALHDLSSLASDLDSAMRSGSPPPSDIVQRQEAIDHQIDEARDLIRSGK
ncbi:MAG TPA: hypothetical protein VII75_07890 [Thermoanaerobaculia bacterium]|nr:hypothetical protein [Thermoanaerobaculia bacterium]